MMQFKKLITFTAVPLQKTGVDVLAIALMLYCQMFGHPPFGNFAEPKKVMH